MFIVYCLVLLSCMVSVSCFELYCLVFVSCLVYVYVYCLVLLSCMVSFGAQLVPVGRPSFPGKLPYYLSESIDWILLD